MRKLHMLSRGDDNRADSQYATHSHKPTERMTTLKKGNYP
jgi:hypothetical protein